MKVPPKILGWKLAVAAACVMATLLLSGSEEPVLRVEPVDTSSPREPEQRTQEAVIRDYLLAWQALDSALQANRPDLLDSAFVGVAKDKLTDTIRQQQKLGIQTRYKARSHDLRLVFYSPEGLSIQLVDTVEYDVQLFDHDKSLGTHAVRARYVAVLSPTEVRWKVRILQAMPE